MKNPPKVQYSLMVEDRKWQYMSNVVRTRFAPSPTGDPHIGNIRTALFAYLFARHEHGAFILRIEDTDKVREVPGSIDRIQESLHWLGINFDEGPILQSQRLDVYRKAAQSLVDHGNAYYCFCTTERLEQLRRDQKQKGLPPMYDQHCRSLDPKEAQTRAKSEPHVIRMQVPATGSTAFDDVLRGTITFQNETLDDQVLVKSDGYPTYHLAVVVDDHDMAISHIIRAEDWISSTPKHVLLYKYFGWQLPTFVHLSLIVGSDRRKLSKRLGDTSLLSYKAQGYTHQAMINFLVRLGFSPTDDRKLYTIEELAREFSLERLHKNPAIFDIEKLKWFNRLAKEQQGGGGGTLAPVATAMLQAHHVIQSPPTDTQYHFVSEAVKRIDTVDKIEATLAYLWQDDLQVPFSALLGSQSNGQRAAILTAALKALEKLDVWDETRIGNALRDLAKTLQSTTSKDFYQLITIAITGSTAAPPLFASMALLGKEKTLSRLSRAIDQLE